MEHYGKGTPMFGENTLFESCMRDFEAIENDPNKNVEEKALEITESEDFVDKFKKEFLKQSEDGTERDTAIKNALNIVSHGAFAKGDTREQKRWFEKFSNFVESYGETPFECKDIVENIEQVVIDNIDRDKLASVCDELGYPEDVVIQAILGNYEYDLSQGGDMGSLDAWLSDNLDAAYLRETIPDPAVESDKSDWASMKDVPGAYHDVEDESKIDETEDIKAMYSAADLPAPDGKGVHTKAFHELAIDVAKGYVDDVGKEEAMRRGYATAMDRLGKEKAVKKAHQRSEAKEKTNVDKGEPMTASTDAHFESLIDKFSQVETDENKNVEVKEDTKSDLVDIANTRLGWAVAEQLKSILDNPTPEGIEDAELNANAIRLIYDFLRSKPDKLSLEAKAAIEDWVEKGWGDPSVLESEEADEKKAVPSCSKCSKKHWPFKKCSEAGKVEEGAQEDYDAALGSVVALVTEFVGEDISQFQIEAVLHNLVIGGGVAGLNDAVRAYGNLRAEMDIGTGVEEEEFTKPEHEIENEVEEVDEQLTPRSDNLLYISQAHFGEGWDLFKTSEGSNQATQIFTFVSEEAAEAAGSKIADIIGGEFKGKEDPRVDPSQERSPRNTLEAEEIEEDAKNDWAVFITKPLKKRISKWLPELKAQEFARLLTGIETSKAMSKEDAKKAGING